MIKIAIIIGSTRPGRVGESSFGLSYKIHDKATGRLVCEGESVQVAYDYARQQKKPLAPELREKLSF